MAKSGRKARRRSQVAGVRVCATQAKGRGIGITTYVYGLSREGDGKDDGASDVERAGTHKFIQELLNPSSTDQD